MGLNAFLKGYKALEEMQHRFNQNVTKAARILREYTRKTYFSCYIGGLGQSEVFCVWKDIDRVAGESFSLEGISRLAFRTRSLKKLCKEKRETLSRRINYNGQQKCNLCKVQKLKALS